MSRTRREASRWRPATRWRDAVEPGSSPPYAGELIRLAGDEIDPDSGEPLGIFQIASRLKRDGTLAPGAHDRLTDALCWFSSHLAVPLRFSHWRGGQRRSPSGRWLREPIAISWFKPNAASHLEHIHALAILVRDAGIAIHELRTTKPGYITYEDDAQVVAVPFPRDGSAPPDQ